MRDNQIKVIERQLEAFDVDKRREELSQLIEKAGLRWRQRLIAAYPDLFDSAAGVALLDGARKGVTNIKNTVLVIECLKAITFDEAALIKRQKLVIPQD